jgi:hypothetical protein
MAGSMRGGGVVWCAERVNSVQMVVQGLVLSEQVFIGRVGKVNRLTDL